MNRALSHILERFAVAAYAVGLTIALASQGAQSPETQKAMAEVVKIAHAISIVQPRLEEPKYFEYALGIYRAAKKYEIRPALIIAIAQQESSFKERLPEGKAGELGITQILKRWVNNPKFRREFPHATQSSFKKPAESFLYTAWILHELKQNEAPGTLPFWSFYNARGFKHRIKYFVRVNKHMAKLKRNLHIIEEALEPATTIAAKPVPGPTPSVPSPRTLAFADRAPTPVVLKPKSVVSFPWVEVPSKKNAARRPDPRAALLRSASFGG
jgi:hypothetical protein